MDPQVVSTCRQVEARTAIVSRTEEFNRRYREIPAWAELERMLHACEGAEEILVLARRFVEHPEAVEAAFDLLVAAARADKSFRPPLRSNSGDVHTGLVLLDKPQLTVSIAVATPDAIAAKRAFRTGGASISFPGYRSIFRFVKSGGALISFWEAPKIEQGFTATSASRCRLLERRHIEDGETLELDGRSHGFIVEKLFSDLVYVQAMTMTEAAPLMVEYDSRTHEFIGASSADEISSRTQMMLSLLQLMDRRDAGPLFQELLGSFHFHLRWHAMREFLALDAELALPALRDMACGDPHPEVRAAAADTLATFFDEGAQQTQSEEIACPA